MTLLAVDVALARVLDGVVPTEPERVSLSDVDGRVLAERVTAARDQPPFDASSMDGFAVRGDDARAGVRLRIVGESAAGRRFGGALGAGEAVRISTGAPVPEGADAVLVKENADEESGFVLVREPTIRARFIRPAGLDFAAGEVVLEPGRRLGFREIALAAAAGRDVLQVRRRPRVAFLSIGDELVAPGGKPGPDDITAASAVALLGLARGAGASADDLGIVPDRADEVIAAIAAARASGADVLVTLGGASVGDHDVLRPALAAAGMTLDLWRIAMRPGRPMLFGRIGPLRVLGLPGNPVSSLVCSLVFMGPLIEALLGMSLTDPREPALLGADVGPNDTREDYLRARLRERPDGLPLATPFPRQDSSMLKVLADADCLLIRPTNALAAPAGSPCRIIRLR